LSILYRDHRGSLDASMDTQQIFNNTKEMKEHIQHLFGKGKITTQYYRYDSRIDWDTWLIVHNGSPVGFTKGEPK
jgi:hypothetical protein